MISRRIAKLERVAAALVGHLPPCNWCGDGRAPLMIFADDPQNLAPYDGAGRCPRCGHPAPPASLVPGVGAGRVVADVGDGLPRKLIFAVAYSSGGGGC